MWKKIFPSLAALSLLVVGTVAYADHGAVFEETVFAPIMKGGTTIEIEAVATGLTAPLKAVTAPGHPGRIFVVDQPGIIWAIDLGGGPAACPGPNCQVFHDVTANLVPLGVLGANSFDERGLLGVTFHPDYETNGLLYTYTSEPNGIIVTFPTTLPTGPGTGDHQNVVIEWQVPDPTDSTSVVDPGSARVLMRVDWPQFNHDGGDLAFGPDGMLYISMGDGGGADDRDGQLFVLGDGSGVEAPIVGHGLDGNGQKLSNPLGKILRIDVNGSNSANGRYGIPPDNPFVGMPGVAQEIYAFGFRNPYRFSIDEAGVLYVGNVGQNDLEEVERVVAGGNYGWPIREGTMFFDHNENDEGFATPDNPGTVPVIPPDLIDPIAQYDTHEEGHAVIGGFVYRGDRIPQLKDRYVFGDFSAEFNFPFGPNNFGRLFYLAQKKTSKDKLLNIQEFNLQGQDELGIALLGIGEDADGELYVLGNISGVPFGTDGVVLRIAPVNNKP